jgi:hypothetical protein
MARYTASNVICAALLVLACLLPFCLATEESWAVKYKKIGEIVVSENRALIHGLENGEHSRELLYLDNVRFCAIPEDQEAELDPETGYPTCNAAEYGKSLAAIALPGIILAGLSLVGCVLYTFCLCCSCCKCCCCGCARKEAKPINKCKNLIIILFTAVAVAIVAVGFAITITGNQQTSVATTELTNVVVDALDTVIARIDAIAERIQNLTGVPQNVNDIIQAAQDTLTTYKSDSSDTIAIIQQIDQARLAVIFIASLVAVIIVGLGFIACFCRKGRKFLMAMSVLAFLSSFVIWVSLALHLVVVEVMHDMCDEINRMEEREANGTLSADNPLGYLIKCRDNDTNMAELFGAVEQGKQFVVNQTCDLIIDSCSQQQIQCSGDYASCNSDNIFTLPNTTYITDRTFTCTVGGVPSTTVNLPTDCDVPASASQNYEANVTIAECAVSCQNTYLRNQTDTAVQLLTTVEAYFEVLDEIEAALNCRFVYDAFQNGKTTICTTFVEAFTYIALGDAFMGGGTAMAIVLFTLKFITM